MADTTTQSASLQTAELSEAALADAIEAECPGRTEWQIMNADETALCMWFTRDDHTRPAHAAQQWLDEHPSKKAEGYHVVERRLHSKREELALEAAKRLRAAPQPPAALVPRYRLLEPGIDRIEPDDEFLKDDGVTWFIDDAGTFVGIVYGGAALLPARRAITGATDGMQK